MKKKCTISIYLFFFCTIAAISQSITIDKNTPLHIDGASTPATTNPSSGTPTANQALDDITINNLGNLGIGVSNASTKLEIKSATLGAIRLEDGSQEEAKVILSDENGNASWERISGSWYALLRDASLPNLAAATSRPYKNYESSYISNSSLGQISAANGSITLPYKGLYRIIISGDMWARRSSAVVNYGGKFDINKNGEVALTFMVSGNSNFGSSFSGINIIELDKDDIITVSVDETAGIRSTSQTSNVTVQVIYIGRFK